ARARSQARLCSTARRGSKCLRKMPVDARSRVFETGCASACKELRENAGVRSMPGTEIADRHCEASQQRRRHCHANIIPPNLPPKGLAKAVRGKDVSAGRKREAMAEIDWLGLWALSLGLCAVVLAAIAQFMSEDRVGAAFILAGAAAIIALVVSGSR